MKQLSKAKKRKMTIIIALILGTAALWLVGSLLMLSWQISHHQNYWNRNNDQGAPAGALRYVALGDSTAQGIGATSPRKGYVGLLAASLALKTGQPVGVINLSKSGARLADCLEDQIPKLQSLEADIITLEIGANDMGSFNEADFRRDMEKVMDGLPQSAVISDLPYFGGGRRRDLEKNVEIANRIIHESADKHGLRVAQLHQLTQERDSLLTMSADLLHPSNRGYRNWHDAFWEVLR